MNNSTQHRSWIFGIHRRVAGAALAFAIVLVAAVIAARSAQAQAYTAYKVYSFMGAPDGASPAGAGLVLDALGQNLYGTTYYGGVHLCNGSGGCGTVFKVDTNLNSEAPLYSFPGFAGDGEYPYAGVVLDGSGNLYGTTVQGGTNLYYGTVFKVDTNNSNTETVLYSFTGTRGDGANPYAGVVLDGSGNLYGTTELAGDRRCNGGNGCGTAFKVGKNNRETVLHMFTGTGGDGRTAFSEGLVRDGNGNLYGATELGGDYTFCQSFGCGTVFKITTNATVPIETVLYRFTGTGGDGLDPVAGLVLDGNGNLYGTTIAGGAYGYGMVFKVTQAGIETVLYSFKGGTDGRWPQAGLVLDAVAGILYGTTYLGGNPACHPSYGCGTVFKVDTTNNQETVLYSFSGTPDGAFPISGLVLDALGQNLYGTTAGGGASGNGTVFKLTL